MKKLSKTESKKIIEEYFSRDEIDAKKTKKMRKLAMNYRISLKNYRKRFCKKCYSDLKKGIVRVSKGYKRVLCFHCRYKNGWKLK